MSSLLADLRKEQMHSRDPAAHVFRITSNQQDQIIDELPEAFGMAPLGKVNRLRNLFGCKVEVLD